MPIWVIAILFTIIYGVIVSPFDQSHWNGYGPCGSRCHGACGGGVIGLVFLTLFVVGVCMTYQFVPGSHAIFQQIGDALHQAASEVQRAAAGM
jgi:hypothetical protein